MFPVRYFGNRMYAPRYFPKVGGTPGASVVCADGVVTGRRTVGTLSGRTTAGAISGTRTDGTLAGRRTIGTISGTRTEGEISGC